MLLSKEQARAELARRGNLQWLLREDQRKMADLIYSRPSRTTTINCHRGFGKTFVLATCCTEIALRKPRNNSAYGGPNKIMAMSIAMPTFSKVFAALPEDIRPKWKAEVGQYYFPHNNSTITILGLGNQNKDSGRGVDFHFACLDEFAFADDPLYTLNSVIMPRLLPLKGSAALSTTPPRSPSHPSGAMLREAKADGSLFTITVDDNPNVNPELMAAYERQAKGRHTTMFRREYLCELIVEETAAVIPLSASLPASHFRKRPEVAGIHVDVKGQTVAVAMAFDGGAAHVVEEHVVSGSNPVAIAGKLKDWGCPVYGYLKAPMVDEFWKSARVHVRRLKGDAQTVAARLRASIERDTLFIHADATTTFRHLKESVWDEDNAGFDISGDGGRFNALWAVSAALERQKLATERANEETLDALAGPYKVRHWGLRNGFRY